MREVTSAPSKLDTHADACCVGKNFQILAYTNRVWDVSAFSNSYEVSKDVPMVLAATKYTDPHISFSIILVVNQALSFPDMEYSLLNPNQLCYAGLDVWDNPFDTVSEIHTPCCGVLRHDIRDGQTIVYSIVFTIEFSK
jgi:hypothetical protein